MPVYNVEKYLRAAIDSVLNQTLRDIELICVDDASTDGSAEILREYAAKDSRVQLVFHEKNSGLVMARKDATALARGEYIMLLDSDDEYTPIACETVWKEEQANPVDILQFGTEAIICRPHNKTEEDELKRVLLPYKYATGNLIADCYEKHLWNYTVWNKAYKASVWKMAIQKAVDAYINISEDEYLFFLVSFFSKTYRGIKNVLYRYYYARGMTGADTISAKKYEAHCNRKRVYEELRKFLSSENRPDLLPICDKMEVRALVDLVYQWRYGVVLSESRIAYQYLLAQWGAVPVISEMAHLLWSDLHEVARRLAPSTLPIAATQGKPVHTIAVFYHRMRNGGVERVISLLIPLWKEMGYSTVLVTEEAPAEDDYYVPEDVPRIQISATDFAQNYQLRAKDWSKIVTEYNVDTIVYNTANVVPLWDICLLKALGCNFVVDVHSAFSSLYMQNDPNRFFYAQCYRLVDRVATLSRVFAQYWGNFCPSYYIPNPLGEICPVSDCVSMLGKRILWVGRISPEKRPEDAIRIFKKVHERFPDATLTVVGKGEKPEDLQNVITLAKKLGVSNYVDFAGYHKDVTPYYQRADILLLTSQYEGFPMVLVESKMHGVPVVMYDLPYLEMVRDGEGVFTAPQRDILSMANLVIGLFENREQLQEAGLKARESLSAYNNDVIKEKWTALFESFILPRKAYCAEENQRMMMNLLLESEEIAVSQSPNTPVVHIVDARTAERLVNSKFQKIAVWYWKITDPIKHWLKRF